MIFFIKTFLLFNNIIFVINDVVNFVKKDCDEVQLVPYRLTNDPSKLLRIQRQILEQSRAIFKIEIKNLKTAWRGLAGTSTR